MKKEVFYIETIIADDEEHARSIYKHYPKKFRSLFELFAVKKVGQCVCKLYLKDTVSQISVKEAKKILSEARVQAIGKDLEEILEEQNMKLVAFDNEKAAKAEEKAFLEGKKYDNQMRPFDEIS
jgi:hypothetical protein